MMRSHLTRNVFRQLLSSEGLVFNCPRRPTPHTRQHYASSTVIRAPPRRNLFGFSTKPQKEARDIDLDPGLRPMLDLLLMDKLKARPPPPANLAKAFNTFIAHKLRTKEAVNNLQAEHVLRTFRFLRDASADEKTPWLTLEGLEDASKAMMKIPSDETHTHAEFAKEIFNELTLRRTVDREDDEASVTDLKNLVTVLTLTGKSTEARKIAETYQAGESLTKNQKKNHSKLWNLVLEGFAREGSEVDLRDAAQMAESQGVSYSQAFQETMMTFYSRKNDIESTKFWYGKESLTGNFRGHVKPTAQTLCEVLRFSIRNDELEWCNTVFRSVLESNPDKPSWDVIFQWAAGGLGKGVEDVERMMDVMIRHNADNDTARPDVKTINGLVDLAMSRNDPYTAERYLALGLKSGIRPNAQSYIMQMNYRIDAGDLAGTQAAYEALQCEEVLGWEDVAVINKYIRTLCVAKKPNYDRIMSLAADMDEKKARLEADTVSVLALIHLERDELQEVLNILHTHTFHHTKAERARTRDAFLAFCLDHKNTPVRAWNAYTILRQVFDETDTEQRTRLMNDFFKRGNCEMGIHVFGHMRQHPRPEKRPTVDTYVNCFEGIAFCADPQSLDMVHNMMKMDSSIEPCTRLYNALMLAYSACELPYRALDFWADITNSREGPTYSSIEIVFRACETKPFGDKPAKEIWNKMRRMEIEVTPAVFSAYVGALAGQALLDEVKSLIQGMQADVGFGPDMITIGSFYNAAPGQNRKDDIEVWARDLYPEIWAELESLGRYHAVEGHQLFPIPRDVKP